MKIITIEISDREASSIATLAADPAAGDARDDVRQNAFLARVLRHYIAAPSLSEVKPSRTARARKRAVANTPVL